MRLKPLVWVKDANLLIEENPPSVCRAGAELRQFHPGAARAERGRSYGSSPIVPLS